MKSLVLNVLLPKSYRNASSTKKSQIVISNGMAFILLIGGILAMTINFLNNKSELLTMYLCFYVSIPFVIFFNFTNRDKLARIILAFYPGISFFVTSFFVGGTMYGDRQPYFLVLMLSSMLPMLLFSDTDEKPFFFIGFLYFAIIISVFDLFLTFEKQSTPITLSMKLKELLFFGILVAGFALKLKQRTDIEKDLQAKNIDLLKKKDEIASLLGIVQEQKEEVTIQQETLSNQNNELNIQKKELVSINTRIGKNIDALLKLVSEHVITNGDYSEALKIITKVASETLQVSRVSVWEFNAKKTAIICSDLHILSSSTHTCGQEMSSKDFPTYFDAIRANKTIVADDAQNNVYTAEFKESYLLPTQIVSMLDSPFFMEGELKGIICFEQQHEIRNWAQEDIFFSRAIADLIPLAYECALRKEAQKKIELQNEELEAKVKTRTVELEMRNKQLEEYAFYNAHIFRAPLCSLQGLMDLALLEKDFKIDEHYLRHFNASISEMMKVTKEASDKLRVAILE